MDTWLKVLISVAGFGAGAEALRQYQQWKTRRYQRGDRNNGFWTDKRILWCETCLVFALLAPIFAMIAMFTFPNFWKAAVVLTAYAGFSFLLLRGLNRPYGP